MWRFDGSVIGDRWTPRSIWPLKYLQFCPTNLTRRDGLTTTTTSKLWKLLTTLTFQRRWLLLSGKSWSNETLFSYVLKFSFLTFPDFSYGFSYSTFWWIEFVINGHFTLIFGCGKAEKLRIHALLEICVWDNLEISKWEHRQYYRKVLKGPIL